MSKMFKDLEDVLNKTSKQLEKGVGKLSTKFDSEAKKLDLKSQIGNHERKIRQAYTRLGEAYFQFKENNVSMNQADIILDSIKANQKVIDLLNKQLRDLD